MNPVRKLYPWIFVTAIPPTMGLGSIVFALSNGAWPGVLVSSIFSLFVLKSWSYGYFFFNDRIVIKRMLFKDRIIRLEEMERFEENPVLVGTQLDLGPSVVTHDGRRYSLPCGISLDQDKFLLFLQELYNKPVKYLDE